MRIQINVSSIILFISSALSMASILYFLNKDYIIAYGDAESHLNISKRVIDSLTPGFAQLGGIWLPLPHLLMTPFVYFDFLWRTGLAGSIISGLSFIIASLFIYKLTLLITKNRLASFLAFLAFSFNPNILYVQSTPLTEMPLIVFFVLSTYYFFKFIKNHDNLLNLILAAFFAFCASLTRYDGWFLVAIEAFAILIFYLGKTKTWKIMEGKFILFSTLAFFGIMLWFVWDFLILGDPLYFTNSSFSAKSQQQGWLARGELPTYHNLFLSFLYYTFTTLRNIGPILGLLGILGLLMFFINEKNREKLIYFFILFVPYTFYVVTLYLGQSVIFIPDLTPKSFEWHLFNVRYGIMMIPAVAFLVGYLISKSHHLLKTLIITVFFIQLYFYYGPNSPVPITFADGISGLSSSKKPDAEKWIKKNYDSGLVLLDDYARTISVVRTGIPMHNIIYIGNKPYWNESLKEPEKYAKWIIMQKGDDVWKVYNDNSSQKSKLYKYFAKVYTSPEILVFKRIK